MKISMHIRTAGSAVAALAVIGLAGAVAPGPPDRGDTARSPVSRSARPRTGAVQPGGPLTPPSRAGGGPEFRSIDGTGNHPIDFDRGAAGVVLRRSMGAAYADGSGAPAGPDRPSARAVSTLVHAQAADRPNALGLSDYLWQWGQFLDHDIDETPVSSLGEAFDIDVPAGDPWFDPDGTGTVTIPLDRSAGVMVDGVRQQLNNITSWIDASNVYGSDEERADALRTLDGTGRLLTSAGDLLPYNEAGLDNAPTSADPSYFLAGDIRANEQVALTAMHTLFVREHNHWAGMIAAEHPELDGDGVYERAREIVAAEMQAITVREFLPRLLGPGALPPYTGYRPGVDPDIANLFAAAAYRVGHTMLSSEIRRIDADGAPIAAGHLDLAAAFFSPATIVEDGIDPILRGLADQRAQAVDRYIVNDVRNFLFGPPGSGGFDLASLNIQRGRDHGLPSYNDVREAYGRPRAASWSQISPDVGTQLALDAAYDDADAVDAWTGLLCEPPRPGAAVGETLYRVLRDQFIRLRDGDRFWYQWSLPPHRVAMIEDQRLSVIIRRNTGIGAELADDVFVVPPACLSDLDGNGMVGIRDLIQVLSSWGACGACPADLDADGDVDFDDLVVVLAAWGPCS